MTMSIETARIRLRALAQKLSFLAPLLIRVTLGVVFIGTGWAKLNNMADTVDNFRGWGIPWPAFNARLAAGTEFFGGILVLLGLGTRLAALPLAFTMTIAILAAKRAEIDGLSTLLGFEEWSYLVMFLTLALVGPGAVSIDALVARRLARAPVPITPPLRPAPAPGGHG
jgi:putative oxidoreductase